MRRRKIVDRVGGAVIAWALQDALPLQLPMSIRGQPLCIFPAPTVAPNWWPICSLRKPLVRIRRW
jgi:hypothetical protein